MTAAARATGNLWKIIDWIFPPFCVGCGRKGSQLCPSCLMALEPPVNPCSFCGKPLEPERHCQTCLNTKNFFKAARAAFLYHSTIRKAIHQLKYSGNLGLSFLFSNNLFSVYLSEYWKTDLVTAVPLSTEKKNERGFNQSEWIGKPLAGAIGIPFEKRALWKKIDTRTQVGLSRLERKENLAGAFIAEPALVHGKAILLVDDVMTTGATFNECSKTLLEAGAKEVFCLSVATTNHLDEEQGN